MRARYLVHASDEWSKEDVRAIVSALLHEPFASDQQLNERIRSRAEVGTLKYVCGVCLMINLLTGKRKLQLRLLIPKPVPGPS